MISAPNDAPSLDVGPRDESSLSASPMPQDKTSTLSPALEVAPAPTPTPLSQPYSCFTKRQKWVIILLSTFAASFSPLSSFIFFPAITPLSDSLKVSKDKINLTITSYMIIAGLAPALLGDLADNIGRRLVYLLIMSIYCLANIGLALQTNWAALFVLRMVQSAGSAGKCVLSFRWISMAVTTTDK